MARQSCERPVPLKLAVTRSEKKQVNRICRRCKGCNVDSKINEILEYWYGDFTDEGRAVDERFAFWFGKSESADREIADRFSGDVDRLVNGEYRHWLKQPKGRLASIILIDQFCRQIFRDTARAFEHDPMALEFCLDGIELGHDLALSRPLRYFYYLPLEHSENIGHQKQCVAAYQAMVHETPEQYRYIYADAVVYAERHQEIIERFGRFPHRNSILGRDSTAEELEFLKQPGSSF